MKQIKHKHKSSLRRDDLFENFDKNKYGSLGIKDVKSEGAFSSPFSKEDRRVTWSDSSGGSTPPSQPKSFKVIEEVSPCKMLMRRIKSDSDIYGRMNRRVSTIGEPLPSDFTEQMRKPTPFPIQKPVDAKCLHILNSKFDCSCSFNIDISKFEIQYVCPCCAKFYKKPLNFFLVS